MEPRAAASEAGAGAVVVGDLGDVGGAQHADMRGVLVRTGKFAAGDLDRGITPDAVLDSVADLPRCWPVPTDLNV